MSKTIQITVLWQADGYDNSHDAKLETGYDSIYCAGPETRQEINMTHDAGETLMSTLLKNKLISGDFCGGTGKCQRCRVRFLEAAPLPTNTERMAFSPDELRKGYRLACMAKPRNSCVICLDFIKAPKMDVITDMISMSEKIDCKGQTGYIIAVDLGTTTIAMQLMDMASGQVLDTYCAINPQRRYGADVLSRIQAANMGASENLHDSVWEVLRTGTEKFLRTMRLQVAQGVQNTPSMHDEQGAQNTPGMHNVSSTSNIQDAQNSSPLRCMCIAGNTTMEHLLMRLPVETLGRSPFTPIEIGFQETELSVPAMGSKPLPVYLVAGISTFVGGDIVAGLYCCRLLNCRDVPALCNDRISQKMQIREQGQAQYRQEQLRHEQPEQKRQEQEQPRQEQPGQEQTGQQRNEPCATLFIDLGTNGEMAITDGRRMIVTATAAGPAFEGGAGASVHGSDMVAITASLLEQGILDSTGLLQEPYFTSGITVPVPGTKEAIRLTQKDIRDLQMAKAAVCAGVEILHEKMGRPAISRVYLAGGFGYYLDVDAAITIGLLPEHVRKVTKAVGNTSLAGAFMIGRDFVMQDLRKEALEQCLGSIESLNLAKQDGFERRYLENLHFPE